MYSSFTSKRIFLTVDYTSKPHVELSQIIYTMMRTCLSLRRTENVNVSFKLKGVARYDGRQLIIHTIISIRYPFYLKRDKVVSAFVFFFFIFRSPFDVWMPCVCASVGKTKEKTRKTEMSVCMHPSLVCALSHSDVVGKEKENRKNGWVFILFLAMFDVIVYVNGQSKAIGAEAWEFDDTSQISRRIEWKSKETGKNEMTREKKNTTKNTNKWHQKKSRARQRNKCDSIK